MNDNATVVADDFVVTLQSVETGWSWVVCDHAGAPKAHGEDANRSVAWRSGKFVAGALSAFRRIGCRRF